MLTEKEKKEEINYQIALIKKDKLEDKKGHLTLNERDKIAILFNEGLSIRNIASILGRNASTISRELKRPEAVFYRGKYIGSQTHKKVKEKWQNTHNNRKLNNKHIRKYVIMCLKIGLSPELIAGRLRTKYSFNIYHETIYKFIYSTHNELNLTQYLCRRKFGRISRSIKSKNRYNSTCRKNIIPNRTDIDLRHIEANLRTEFGHFEADSIESPRKSIHTDKNTPKNKKQSCLTVIVDRKTRLTKIEKTESLNSVQTYKSLINALTPYKHLIKSITYDNGHEFTGHEKINKIFKTKSFFCKPHHSWEKGTVENINGIIRRFFPKGTNFDTINEKDIKYVENWINNRPMKVLEFKTPYEKYLELALGS
ncbi:IS30 family transposase [bacterium]|nr:IS30 family transposase [bacterium]